MPFDPMSQPMQPPMDPMMAEEPMDAPMPQELPPGNYQRLAQSMGQPQMSYAFNPVTDSPEFDVSVLGADVMGVPMDRSMAGMQMGMPMGGMGMGPEMEGMEMEDEDDMAPNPEAKQMAMAALQGKAVQRQAASDGFQANATKLARTMRGPQSL